MKNISHLSAFLAFTLSVLLFTGCSITRDKQVSITDTILGLEASTPMIGTQGAIAMRFGLVRHEYVSNPTGTNKVFAAPFEKHITAKLTPITQSGSEDISAK